jgi:hypothetical protein
MKKLLTKKQIEDLSPAELIAYKKEISKYFLYELKPYVDEFYSMYVSLKLEMSNRIEFLEKLARLIAEDRTKDIDEPTGAGDYNIFTIQ